MDNWNEFYKEFGDEFKSSELKEKNEILRINKEFEEMDYTSIPSLRKRIEMEEVKKWEEGDYSWRHSSDGGAYEPEKNYDVDYDTHYSSGAGGAFLGYLIMVITISLVISVITMAFSNSFVIVF